MSVLVRTALGTVLVAGVALALLEVSLRRPSASDRVAVETLTRLEHTAGTGSVIQIGRRRMVVRCTRAGRASHVSLPDGSTVTIRGTHAVGTSPRARGPASVTAVDLVAAQADLAGSHRLYARQLAARILAGRAHAQPGVWRGRPVHVLRLSLRAPVVELLVDRSTLEPLAARYRSATLRGESAFLARTTPGRGC